MNWKRIIAVVGAVCLIISVIGNINQYSKHMDILKRKEASIEGGVHELLLFSENYENYPNTVDGDYSIDKLTFEITDGIASYYYYVGGRTNKYEDVKDIVECYRTLIAYHRRYGRIEPLLILNRSLLSYLEPLGDMAFERAKSGHETGSRSDDLLMDRYTEMLAERVEEEGHAEDYSVKKYNSTTLQGIHFALSDLPETLEAEGYEEIGG